DSLAIECSSMSRQYSLAWADAWPAGRHHRRLCGTARLDPSPLLCVISEKRRLRCECAAPHRQAANPLVAERFVREAAVVYIVAVGLPSPREEATRRALASAPLLISEPSRRP